MRVLGQDRDAIRRSFTPERRRDEVWDRRFTP
jgi:hypothetical protein